MLVLARKVNQKILIGDDVCITIVQIRGKDRVRIGVEAPANVRVIRDELDGVPDPKAALSLAAVSAEVQGDV